MLPDSIGPWIHDIAERMQAPIDFVGASAMVALGTALGRKVGIRPKAKDTWTEVANLWGMIVGRPGCMKSPAMAEAMKPLQHLETEAAKENEEQLKRWKRQAEIETIRRDEAEKSLRKVIRSGAELSDDALGPDREEAPIARRYIANDATYEALGVILAANPNGILAFRDELVTLLKTLDREEQAPARGLYLQGWNGTSSYTFDRIVRGITRIDAACLSMLGGTQPPRLADYVNRAVQSGAADDGLIQRFQLIVWPDDHAAWRNVDRYPLAEPKEKAWNAFTRLNLLDPMSIGAEQGEFDKLPFIRFDESAQRSFQEWHADLEHRIRAPEMHPALKSHISKYKKLVPALALINHLADGGEGAVDGAALAKAVFFTQYLESHARRVYGSGRQSEVDTAKAIIKRRQANQLPVSFTARDILQKDWSNLSDKGQVNAGLDLLEDLEWVRATDIRTGGRPKVEYLFNPRAFH